MKTMHKNRSGGESCSCTTCVYKSESDHPSLKRIIDLGSRIDRLYYGKYIPLRERKLLERLVRTRAVYDDIRAKLVSDSTPSFSTRGDYNPRNKVSVRDFEDTEKSSGAVLELVNMVDRGAMGSKKLQDCCSCCSCSSKINIHERRHKRQRTSGGSEEYVVRKRKLRETSQRKKGVRFKTKRIKSDPCTCTFKLIKKHSKALYKKMHQIPPVPLFELQSSTNEEIRPNDKRIGDMAYQNWIDSNTRMKEKISEGISKLRESQTRIQEKIELQTKISMEKFNQAKGKLASQIKSGAQKIRELNSSDWLIGPENKIALQVRKDSISKFKEELRRKQIMKDWECEPECIEDICVPEKCVIRLNQKKSDRKNNHHKGMSYNIKTKERKSGKPLRQRQSNYKIQAQKLAKAKTIETDGHVFNIQQTREITGSRVDLNTPRTKIKKPAVTKLATEKQNETNVPKIIPFTPAPQKISIENVKTRHHDKKSILENSSLERQSSRRQAVRVGSSFSFNIEFYKEKPGQQIPVIDSRSYKDSKQYAGIAYKHKKLKRDKKSKKRHHRQQGSQIEIKKTLKSTQSGGHALKRCFCTLKLKTKTNKAKISSSVTKKVMTTEPSPLILSPYTEVASNDVQTNTDNTRKSGKRVRKRLNLLPYECEPGVCLPGQCDPYQCIKLINRREAKRRSSSTQAHKTKSTSSFTSKSYKPSKTKTAQSKVTHRGKFSKSVVDKQRIKRKNAIGKSHRQAVRIGSTFSFNVEFFKDRPNSQQATKPIIELKSLKPIKPKQQIQRKVKRRDRGYQGNLRNVHRNTPTQIVKKEHNARIGTTLRRCFCTLAIQKKDIVNNNNSTKTFTTGTETSELKPINTANKGTKTKLKYSKTLKPYECEPFTCVPGSCDPYVCLDRIQMRKNPLNIDHHETLLEPYECEPFACVPGECDPYVCLERINERNKSVKEIGLSTGRSKTTSSSSGNTYLGKSSRTVQMQHKPRYKERKVSAETRKSKKYVKLNKKKYDVTKYPSSSKSGQAVKIGSTFSFNIEFYKNKPQIQEIKRKYPAEIITRASSGKRSINKGVKVNRLNVAQVETQIQGAKKHDKGSVVGPLLKRCFCTLNLQKKWKNKYFKNESSPSRRLFYQRPRVYTVNRAMIGYTQGIKYNKNKISLHNSFYRNLNIKKLKKTSALQSVHNMNAHVSNNTLESLKEKSDLHPDKQMFKMSQQSKETNSQQCIEQMEMFADRTVAKSGLIRNSSLSSHFHETRFTSLTGYFRRYFYAMNLKVEHGGNYIEHEDNTSKKIKKQKLLPYECEPGICIPGECNPYECQKMIAKRLMKTSSKKSGTRYSSHSISSSANQPRSKSKVYKQQTLRGKSRKPHVTKEDSQVYKKSNNNIRKQAVRIGSSFSFDIEFSKNKSTPNKNNLIIPKYSSDTNIAKRLQHSSKSKSSSARNKSPDSQSQSVSIETIDRGSVTKPSMKRCFCTLKLQKRGRLYKQFKHQTNPLLLQPLIPLRELSENRTVSRAQNTMKAKPLRETRALKPYECEPNTCIPGQCDPYTCLEKIKKRNYYEEVGTNTILDATKTISSVNTDAQRKKMHRNRAVGVKPKKKNIIAKNRNRYPKVNNAKSKREAVRVGSSFSFNIEFFKDRPQDRQKHPHDTHTYTRRQSKEKIHSTALSPSLKKHTDSYTQNEINIRHKQSQFENITRRVSTLTNSFMKRCFCTAQLYNSKNTNAILKPDRNDNSPSFMKRCFCALKKFRPNIKNTITDSKLTERLDKNINTVKVKYKPKLERYECKPNICVPGECDPYVCDKIMTKYRKENSKATTADIPETRSISSNSAYIAMKDVKTLIKRKENPKIKNRKAMNHKGERTQSIYKPNPISFSPERNVVRIGSKFSFDIEFSKDNSVPIKHDPKSETHKTKLIKDTNNRKKVKMNSTITFNPSHISQSSQVKKIKVKHRGIGINNFVKRCFCTLKLYQTNKYNEKRKREVNDDDQISKQLSTKSVMTVENRNMFRSAYECEPNICIPYQCDPYECKLRNKFRQKNKFLQNTLLPYECEPNTCIPYQCDPYECEKRIRLRQKNQFNREFGISTPSPTKVSAYSITDTMKPNTKSQSMKTKNLHHHVIQTPNLYSDIGKVGKSKQSVRIGSSFSFNIEFFKDKRHDGFELQKLPKKDHHNDWLKNQIRDPSKFNSNQINHRSKKVKSSQAQFEKNFMNTNETQYVNQVMRTQSTMTRSAPIKRCFCTLSLQKSKVKPPLPVKTSHVSTETDISKPNLYSIPNLLPYECEPNVCIPDDCNPVQCLERIKRRQGTLLPFECEPNVCVAGDCDPIQCLERIKMRHKRRRTVMTDLQKTSFGTGMGEPQNKSVSTIMRKRRNVKNKNPQSKRLHNRRTKVIDGDKTGSNNNRHAVRIGSNFNFDVEFYKTNNRNHMDISKVPQIYTSNHRLRNKGANNDYEKNKLRSQASQLSSPKKLSRGSSISPFLKRCFCTLKLQKNQVKKAPLIVDEQIIKSKPRQTFSENKSTGTRKISLETYNLSAFECEPFYCMPGECDPYECAKRIKMRGKKYKSQYTITRFNTQSQKGVGIKPRNMKPQGSEASFIDKNVVVPKSNIKQHKIVEIPRFTNIFNKQAVRIGSNFSFNVEFYKENLPLTSDNLQVENGSDRKIKGDRKTERKGHIKHIPHHHKQNTNMVRLLSTGSDYDKTISRNKSVGAENILKRCFCTLKLQNMSSSMTTKKNMLSMKQYPQTFEVRRVAVRTNPKILSKDKLIGVKSIATKMNKEYLKRDLNYLNAPCNLSFCNKGETLLPEDMKTILPYMPQKYNKTLSRTVLPLEQNNNNFRESILINRGKRLTHKRSEKYLHNKPGMTSFFSWCTRIFHPKSNSQKLLHDKNKRKKLLLDRIKPSGSERQARLNQVISTKLKPKKCNPKCPHYLVYQSGNTERWPPGISVKLNKKNITKPQSLNIKSNTKNQAMSKMKHKDCSCTIKLHKKQNTKHKYFDMNESENNGKENNFRKDNGRSSPLRVRFKDTTVTKSRLQNDKMNVINLLNSNEDDRFASGTKSDRVIHSSKYCLPCRGKIIKEEFQKAAGDQLLNKQIANKIKSPYYNVDKIKSKIRDTIGLAMNAEKPLLEMQIDSRSNEIINRNEVMHNVAKLKRKCKPMVELQLDSNMHKILNKRAVISHVIDSNTKSKENNMIRSVIGVGLKKIGFSPWSAKDSNIHKPTGKPCICGSSVCAKRLKNVKTPITRHKWKTCVCGSPVCYSESAKIKAWTDYVENKCLCQKEMAKRKEKKLEKQKKERAMRLKLYEKSDKKRRKKRKKEHKRLENTIDKKAGDAVLFAESVLDVGKLGITATTDLLRHVARCARDPKHAYQTLRLLEENPRLVSKFLKSTYHDTGLSGTFRRIRLRCLAMRGILKLRRQLNRNPFTHYLMNVTSMDPNQRVMKRKGPPKRERERLDFHCSLYMASLRNKPYLSVYDRCPWFYQHFLSLVYAWKQFIDICLFLLAAVVWSPCILCMEICRACMCCFFCTG